MRQLIDGGFEVRAHAAGGRLGPQGEIPPDAVVEPIELLRDGVSVFAESLDQLSVLDDRRDDLFVAVWPGHGGGAGLGRAPYWHFGGKDVADAADSFDRLGAGHRSVRL